MVGSVTMPEQINVSTLDRFSVAHFFVGFVKQRMGLSLAEALALSVLWELVEDKLKDAAPSVFPHASHDTKRNAVGDIGCVLAGFEIARRVRRR